MWAQLDGRLDRISRAPRKPLWAVTIWDKKFNSVASDKQKSAIKYHYLLAGDLKEKIVPGGNVKLLTTSETDWWTTEDKVAGLVSEGEIVSIPWGGNPNVQYFNGRFVTADNRIATSSDKRVLDNKFLYYFMLAKKNTIGSFYRGAGLKHPEMAKVLDMEIPLPDIESQRSFAGCMDRLARVVSVRKSQLGSLSQLVKSRFVEMFGDVTSNPMGWIRERLESHIDVLAGYPFDSSQYVESGGINICGGLIIMPGWIDWGQCKKWRSAREVEQYLLNDGDIVMALDRPWISTGFKVAQVHKEELPALLIQRTARIRGVDIDQSFLLYLLKDRAFERHCTVTGSLVPHISHKDIKSYEVIVPPLALRREFAAFVAKVDKLAFAARQRRDVAKQLYRAKIQEFFG